MPKEVIAERIITLSTKYVLSNQFTLSHILYMKDAVTNFPNSNTAPIVTIGQNAAENISVRPMIEKYPATADIPRAVKSNM
jgi:hypothetical protein